MDHIELLVATVFPEGAATAEGAAGKSAATRVRTYSVAKSSLHLAMDPKALKIIASVREDAQGFLRRIDRKGYSRITAYVDDEGATHVVYVRDTRTIAPSKRKGVKRGPRKDAAAAVAPAPAPAPAPQQ